MAVSYPDNIPTFTDTQMLNALRYALVQVTLGQEVEIAGRKVTLADAATIQALIREYESRIAVAGDPTGGGIALATANDADIGASRQCQ